MSRHDYHQMLQKELPGYNMVRKPEPKPMWNLDFQSYCKPLSYRIREQDENGGALVFMLIALAIGLIIFACI